MSAIHFCGPLSWWDGRWKQERLAGWPSCKTNARTGRNIEMSNDKTSDAAKVTCKSCLKLIAKAAANQEQIDPEPELAADFFEGVR